MPLAVVVGTRRGDVGEVASPLAEDQLTGIGHVSHPIVPTAGARLRILKTEELAPTGGAGLEPDFDRVAARPRIAVLGRSADIAVVTVQRYRRVWYRRSCHSVLNLRRRILRRRPLATVEPPICDWAITSNEGAVRE